MASVPVDWTPLSSPTSGSDERSAFGAYTRALRSQALLASLLFVLVVGLTVVYTVKRSPSYQATATLLINPLPQTNTAYTGLPLIRDSGDPTTNMQTAATVIDSPAAADAAARLLGHPWTGTRVQNAVSVQPEGQSEVLDITATASSARLSERIANAYSKSVLALRAASLKAAVAKAIVSTRAQLAPIKDPSSVAASGLQDNLNQLSALSSGQDPTVSLSESAIRPTAASGVSRLLILVLGLIVAIALASGAALFIELVRARRIVDEDHLLQVMPGPVIGRVPRYGGRYRRSLGDAQVPPAVSEALRAIRIQLDLLPGRHRTILLTSASHGDGKTTTTVNLARELANSGARVLVIDADLRKPDVGNRFGVQPGARLADALEAPDPVSLAKRVPTESPLLKVLAATADPDFRTLDRIARVLGDALERCLEEVDYVLLDAPPLGEVADILRFIGVVDDVLLVSRIGHTRLGHLEVARELLELAAKPPTGHVTIGYSPRQPPSYGYYQQPPSNRPWHGREDVSGPVAEPEDSAVPPRLGLGRSVRRR